MPIIRNNPIRDRRDTEKIFDTLAENGYDLRNLRYPEDLEDEVASAHAVIFYINETTSILNDLSIENIGQTDEYNKQQAAEYAKSAVRTSPGNPGGRVQPGSDIFQPSPPTADTINKKRDNRAIQYLDAAIAALKKQVVAREEGVYQPDAFDRNAGKTVTTKVGISAPKIRSSHAIVLGIPDRIPTASYQTNYESFDNGALVAGFLRGLNEGESGGDLADALAGAVSSATKNIPALVAALGMSTLSGLAPDLVKAGQGILGAVPNPHTEFLFKAPSPRSFSFEFKFRPRSEKEVYNIRRIIETFKYHMHPDLSKDKNFYIVPSNFDIHYVYSTVENKWLNRIGTCVLESMNVDYSPNGFSSFRPIQTKYLPDTGVDINSPGNNAAPPTEINLTLNFKEISLLTREDIEKGL